ncbi:hypothetical protein DL767_008479 [Monosporascus sp. MG133]|nr:hypothetical protein DL767_008479 [Monosporascus sp. MG133]
MQPSRSLRLPAVARVCRAALAIAKWFSGRWHFMEALPDDGSLLSLNQAGRWTWFDGKRDTLFIRQWTPPTTNTLFHDSGDSREKARTPRTFALDLVDRTLWPELETYLYCAAVVYLHLPDQVIRASDVFADGNQKVIVGADDRDQMIGHLALNVSRSSTLSHRSRQQAQVEQ